MPHAQFGEPPAAVPVQISRPGSQAPAIWASECAHVSESLESSQLSKASTMAAAHASLSWHLFAFADTRPDSGLDSSLARDSANETQSST